MPVLLKLVLVITALAAAYYDLRVRRIPNWINVSGVILGLLLNAYLEGIHGFTAALGGLGLALCIYLPLYVLKGMGAGDVKLMAALGSIAGPGNWLNIFVITAIFGGIISLALILWRRRFLQTLFNVGAIVAHLAHGQRPSDQDKALSIHNSTSLKMPHGVTIAAGVCLFLLIHRPIQ